MAKLEEVLALTEKAGIAPDAVSRWWDQNGSNPQLASAPSDAIAQKFIERNKAPAQASPAVPTPPQAQMNLPSSYAGTKFEQSNPGNPAADSLNQFHSSGVNDAYKQFADQYNSTLRQRNLSQFMASAAGPESLKASRESWGAADKIQEQATIGKQKALQEQAGQGIDAAGKIQGQNVISGKFGLEQGKSAQDLAQAQQKTAAGGMGLANEQELNNPGSAQTALAKQLAADQLKVSGNMSPEMRQLLAKPGVTAADILPFLEPKIQESFKQQVGMQQTQVGTAKTSAEILNTLEENRKRGIDNTQTIAVAESLGMKIPDQYRSSIGGSAGPGNVSAPSGSKSQYASQVEEAAKRIGVDPAIALHVLGKETGSLKNASTATSSAGAKGVMQLMPGTAKDLGLAPGEELDPTKNIDAGLRYLKQMKDKFGDDKLALLAYNWGPGNVEKWVKAGSDPSKLPAESKGYIQGMPGGDFTKLKGALDRKEDYGSFKPPVGSNASISTGSGGTSISMSPGAAITGQQASAAKDLDTGRAQSKVNTEFDLGNNSEQLAKISEDAVKAGVWQSTGSVSKWMENLGGVEQGKIRAQVHKMVDGKIAYMTAAGMPAPKREEEVARIMSQTPAVFQKEVLQLAEQTARQDARQAAMEKHVKGNGTIAGFDDSKIRSAIFMRNPKTGESALVSPNNVGKATNDGFVKQ